MSNITDSNTELVGTLADTFFTWFQKDILPVCTAIFDVLVIVVGITLNILLIVTFRQRGLFNETSTYFVFVLCIADLMSYLLLLIPNVISAIARTWILTEPVCTIHGSTLFVILFVNFGITSLLCIERSIKLCSKDVDFYDKIFESGRIRTTIIIAVWTLAVVIGLIPVTGAADVEFDIYHQGCMLNYKRSPSFLILHFLLTIGLSFIVAASSYVLIFDTRRKAIKKDRLERISEKESEKNDILQSDKNSSYEAGSKPHTTESDMTKIRKNFMFEKSNMGNKIGKHTREKGRRKSKTKQSLVFEVFSDDKENPAFHLAITYLALWGTIIVCYLPYMVVSFYGTYSETSLWGGFYTITLLLVHTCFAVKPVVYLGHNRHYRHVTKQTIPDAIKTRARSMSTAYNRMSETLDDLIFRSNAHAKFRTALATQKAVLIWKRRLQNRKGMETMTEESEPERSSNSTDISQRLAAQHSAKNSSTDTPAKDADRTSVTPSNVVVTTASSFATSDFIEKERRRLLNNNTKSVHWAALNDSGETVSLVPGMVDGRH